VSNLDRLPQKRKVKVYPALREMCLNYTFWPRQPLHIEDLASILSSSATPVREALARLAGEGLIDAVPNRGYVAKMLCDEEMRDSIDLLVMLLKSSIERCNLPESWTLGSDDARGEAHEQSETGLLARVDHTFVCISNMSHNEIICEQVMRLLEVTRLVRKLDLEDPTVARAVRASLEELRNSLNAGDGFAAIQNLHHQNRDIQQRLAHIVKEERARSMSRLARDVRPQRASA
jgi:DNA-binding GntR family transcriptional regulator